MQQEFLDVLQAQVVQAVELGGGCGGGFVLGPTVDYSGQLF